MDNSDLTAINEAPKKLFALFFNVDDIKIDDDKSNKNKMMSLQHDCGISEVACDYSKLAGSNAPQQMKEMLSTPMGAALLNELAASVVSQYLMININGKILSFDEITDLQYVNVAFGEQVSRKFAITVAFRHKSVYGSITVEDYYDVASYLQSKVNEMIDELVKSRQLEIDIVQALRGMPSTKC